MDCKTIANTNATESGRPQSGFKVWRAFWAVILDFPPFLGFSGLDSRVLRAIESEIDRDGEKYIRNTNETNANWDTNGK